VFPGQQSKQACRGGGYSVNMRRAIITWSSHSKSARKTVWLLQFRRPSLRSAVTASLLSPMKTAAAEQRCDNLLTQLASGLASPSGDDRP
jgi:hypothetical protein